MKILFLTFYYPPDLSAGSYRALAMVEALTERFRGDVEIDVVTTTPNRYASFTSGSGALADEASEHDRVVNVHRVAIPDHRSGVLDQSRCFLRYAVGALRYVRGKRYDLVLATTSRLFTGFLGALVAPWTDAKLYLDVRDVFVETVEDLLRERPTARALLVPVLRRVEAHTVRRAARVNLVSPRFKPYFSKRYPRMEVANFSNGIDALFLSSDFRKPQPGNPRIVLYAGNIGFGQALDKVIPDAARRLGEGIRFRVIGDGGRKQALEDAVALGGIDNVEILPPTGREQLCEAYREADILLLHLNDVPALDRVLPSKIFEYAATCKPIVAGVRGYAKSFVEEEVDNAVVFPPCSSIGLVEALSAVELESTNRDAFKCKFARTRIMKEMADDVADLL